VDGGLVEIDDWAEQCRGTVHPSRTPSPTPSRRSFAMTRHKPSQSETRQDYNEITNVLVIEAFGVSDNEVFARSWCANWGLNALVANVTETCMACAIREAYAACLSVVILSQGGSQAEKDDEAT
jgi:hypothetical protein